jgi:hypothetical protein
MNVNRGQKILLRLRESETTGWGLSAVRFSARYNVA